MNELGMDNQAGVALARVSRGVFSWWDCLEYPSPTTGFANLMGCFAIEIV
jgi:hypothetical protein